MGRALVVVAIDCRWRFGQSIGIGMRCRFLGFFGYLCGCGICVAIWLVLDIAYGLLGCVVVV